MARALVLTNAEAASLVPQQRSPETSAEPRVVRCCEIFHPLCINREKTGDVKQVVHTAAIEKSGGGGGGG